MFRRWPPFHLRIQKKRHRGARKLGCAVISNIKLLKQNTKKKNFYHVFDFLTFQRLKNSKISILHSTIKSLNRDIQSGEVDGKEQMLLSSTTFDELDSYF